MSVPVQNLHRSQSLPEIHKASEDRGGKTCSFLDRSFCGRIIKYAYLGLGTFFFPLTVGLVGIKSLVNVLGKKNADQSVKTKIITVVTSMLFPLPIVGPVLTYKFGTDQTFKCLNIQPSDAISTKQRLMHSIPFVSSFIASENMLKALDDCRLPSLEFRVTYRTKLFDFDRGFFEFDNEFFYFDRPHFKSDREFSNCNGNFDYFDRNCFDFDRNFDNLNRRFANLKRNLANHDRGVFARFDKVKLASLNRKFANLNRHFARFNNKNSMNLFGVPCCFQRRNDNVSPDSSKPSCAATTGEEATATYARKRSASLPSLK